MEPRIINVSNRLPIKLKCCEGEISYEMSEGGLATSLRCVFEHYEHVWLGWAGAEIPEDKRGMVHALMYEKNLHPVFLNAAEINGFYEGFSNEILWPLFHYFPNYSNFDLHYWEVYQAVNRKYAEELMNIVREGDVIWVHDYQLMLLPQMLRQLMPNVTIGYFQHIPFPSAEVFMCLPWRDQILEGLLGADIIGFQTPDDKRHFTEATARLLGKTFVNDKLECVGHTVGVQAFPISVDYEQYRSLALQDATLNREHEIRRIANGRKIAISIDRLDYSKGILQRLRAFEYFLDKNPEWRGQITLIHLIVPSRDTVRNYKELKEEMDKLVSSINGRLSTLDWCPILNFYRSFAPDMLSAMYKTADVALVTPVRDGMNLVAKEFVVSNVDKTGVLVLSEAAGAANELRPALQINPNDMEAFAAAIHQALTMPTEEKAARMEQLQQIVAENDLFAWADAYIGRLLACDQHKNRHQVQPLSTELALQIDTDYNCPGKRLLLLDYDGTLVPFEDTPEAAVPDQGLLDLLGRLSADKNNKVAIVSGRDWRTLQQWFGDLPVDLVAEHGAWVREGKKNWTYADVLNADWKAAFYPCLHAFTKNTPGSFIEEKSWSLGWHYRQCDSALGDMRAMELIKALQGKLDNYGLQLLQGSKVIEIKSMLVNKGSAVCRIASRAHYNFIMAVGDDVTDEDMFSSLPARATTIKVGVGNTRARFRLPSFREVRYLLTGLTESFSTVKEWMHNPLIDYAMGNGKSVENILHPGR